MPEREMFGPRARRVQDLSSRCTVIEASNDDGQLRTPRFDPAYQRPDGGAATAAQSDDDERGTLVAQPRHEQIAIGMKLQGERRLAGAHTQRATQGVILPSYHHYSGKHRDLRV